MTYTELEVVTTTCVLALRRNINELTDLGGISLLRHTTVVNLSVELNSRRIIGVATPGFIDRRFGTASSDECPHGWVNF